jgi:hypothetical protein
MGLYDDLLEEQPNVAPQKNVKNNTKSSGLYDDLLVEEPQQTQPTFAENHPFVASIPEAGKQFGVRAVKSFPEFARGVNDLTALIGDKTGLNGLSDFGRSNAEFWQNQSDKIQIDPKYQGLKGLSSKETFLPTVLGSVGDQATNLLMAGGGGGAGAKAAATMGLKGAAKAGLITAGTSIPNLAQEGTYLDKIQQFQELNGRMPTLEELKQIQNVALGEKAINTALETVSDRLLFGKFFPEGAVTKGVKGVIKSAGQQALTEAATEGMQEGVSIGAEKLLGMNQGDNLARLADAMAIGGVTGGVMGGVGTAASQPLNTQFDENQSAINPVEAIQNVSAKIVDGGKVLYDSAADKLNAAASNIANATTAVGDMVSAPSSFDTLRALSKEGALSNHIENIAPNTVKKQRAKKIKNNPETVINNSPDVSVQDTGVPNMIEDTNLYNVSENGENTITNAQNVENIANEVQQETPSENTAVLEKNKKEIQKTKAKAEAIEKIKKIAPKTAEKIETEQKNTKEIGLKDRLKELGYNNNDVDNFFNAIENKENVDLSFGNTMFNGLLNTKEEADFIKAQELNKLTKEYRQSKKLQKNNKAAELAPKTVEKVQNDTFRKINDEHTARIMQVYNKYTQQDILAGKANAEIEAINKEFEPLEKTALDNNHTEQPLDMVKSAAKNEKIKEIAPNITEANKNKEELIAKAKDLGIRGNLKAMKPEKLQAKIKEAETKVEPQKHISEGWKVQDFIDDLEPQVNQIYEENSIQKPFKNRQELKKWCMENQPYYKKYIPDVVNYFANKHNILNDFVKEESVTTKKKGEIKNGHSAEKTNGNRSNVSEREKTTETNTSEIPQGKSANERTVDEIGRGHDISNDGKRGISQKDKEVIEKEYKNQHELNKAIEDYINNGEYKKYAGSVRMPQAIKDWLKKYAGAGGLEKQGAEGKGLLSEYYTPQNIVNKMWDLTAQYVNTNGAKVLEPSVGIGRFLENAPKNTSFDVVEMNPVSAKITKILYPDTNVTTGEFQERFIDKTNNKPVKSVNPEYDIVIGNPPYGQYSGRYKGMGEGKKYSRLEAYFINRGLDSLKENGIMTFIVPSSFLEGAITPAKQEIGSKCELVDAYRLPENMFDTTSLGTDIVVLRKTALKSSDKNLNLGKWFNEHPEKVLGTVEQRKNRFGKLENVVKGDKNVVDNIDTSKKDIKETVVAKSATTEKTAAKKSNHIVNTNKKVKKPAATVKGKVEYTEYQHDNTISDAELELFQDTRVDGTLPESKYKPNEKVNEYKGKLYNDFNYLQGDIYEKLEDLENSEISEKQKEIQKKKLLSVLPEPKTVENIAFNPTSDFIREQSLGNLEEEVYDYSIRDYKKVNTPDTLDRRYKKYIDHLTNSERNGVSTWDMKKFIDGDKIRIDYHYSSYSLTDAEKKAERNRQYAEYMTKLKNTVDKTFNDYVKNELTKEEKQKLEDAWNRKFNATYNPDFKKMPMIVKGLNSEFYGKKLKLQNVQVEGVNFLTNKGVGLLGFEVGVGKTLTGIISTVQNMQMGRCKKPLVLVPKQVKDNWIKEFKETFPNLEINDVDNMSKFKGEIKENTVTVATYEALGNIWYGENSANDLIDQIYSVSNDFNRESTKRGKEKTKERAEELVGKAEGGNKKLFNIQEIGFDHLTIDEAHNFKNLFADAKADGQEGNTYVNISGGSTSTRAARLFLLTQYVLNNNGNRNVFMLTATPFNNSPLEVFNMLSYLAKDELDKKGLYNVYQFMENYADINSDWIVNSRNEVEYKQVVTGFKNASSLRELIKSVMLIRSAEDAGIVRPEKYTKRVTLEPSQEQIDLIAQAEEEAVTGKKDEGAVLKAINQSRKATLSPDIATDNFDVSPEDFIKNSPKLNYIMSAVESMKKKDSKTSQLIYMPLGVKFLPKIKQYLVNKGVFTADEVAIIDSSVSDDKITKITDSFNDREGKVKLVIGTNKIKEGMNLNKNSSVLYVPYMDWNPTDFVQVVGRIWRRGNRYSKIRVVVPLLKNSSDSFMFQKLNEKTDRINNIMDESKEYIDTSELNTSEEKINMISNPEKKMKMFVQVEKQKLNAKVQDLQGRLETSQAYLGKLKSDEKMLKYSEEQYAENSEKIKNIDPEKDKWDYEYTQKRINEYKKDVASYKLSLKKVKEKIARLELDFEGKDSEEVINAEIEKVNQDIQDVEEYGKKKLVEFTEEYENERKNKKSISELIKEFEKDTIELYGDDSVEESKPLTVEPTKRYEKTRESAYSVPVIKLETKAQKTKKSRTKSRIEKAKQIIDARKYNKVLKEGVQKWHAQINLRRYEADRVLNNFINITKGMAKEIGVNDKNLREIMPFLRERTELPEGLNRPELETVWEKVHNKNGMAERLTNLADTASNKFEKFWNEYKAVQASGEYTGEENKIKNYINHEWDLGNGKEKSLLTNYFATTSKHGKQRTIDTYYQGINGIQLENGEIRKLKPKVLDYAALLKMQSDNLIKATCDKALADSVKSFKTAEGANLVLPASQAPSNWVEINHSALNKTVARPVTTKFGEKVAPDLQNKLAEIGVAIGNRIPARKGNGSPNSLGRFVKNQPPEIRLQRWFSNKTLAHEVGHAIDNALGLQDSGFVNRHREELLELNRERIEAFAKQGEKKYAEKDSELIAELFGVMFNDIESALKYAPAATSEIMSKMTENKKFEGLLPANYDWSDAKHVMEEKIVEFFKMPVRVHPDIAATLKTVFEPKKEYLEVLGFKPGKAMDDVNAVAKMFNFSLSGFHAWALSESYLGNTGVKGLKDTFNFKKIYDSIKNNDYDIYKKDEVAKRAIEDGLQIGATLDVQRGVVENLLDNTGKWLENNVKGFGRIFSLPVKTVAKGTELNNKALWDVIHNNYKLNTYELLVENESKNGVISDAKRKEIAQWVNDSFGGLVWENLGISPSTKKAFSRWLMSPDWLLSSTRQFFGMFSSKTGHQKLNKLAATSDFWQKVKDTTQFFGINSMTDDINASGMRGQIARRFWTRAAIQSIIYMNILNAVFRMWDRDKNPDLYPEKMTAKDYSMLGNSVGQKTCVFAGRNSDGTERYVRFGKQFREVPEMVEDPIKKIGGKIAPIPQTAATIMTGHSLSGFENKEMSEAKGWKRVGVAAKQGVTTFLPFSVGSAINKKGDYSPFDLVATTSKGMSKYKAGEKFKDIYSSDSDPKKIEEIEKAMRMNRFSDKDIKTIRNRAKGQTYKQYKDDFKIAIEAGDTNKVKKISEKMEKKHISKIDQREIYLKALKDYYKSRGIGQ